MLYLNDRHMLTIGADWHSLTDRMERTVRIMDSGDYAQPIKPYLRYGDPRNRIIAMPAYLGGSVKTAGLKWIASFPGNRERGLPRAHGLIVLNRFDTGEPIAVLNGGLPNVWRTAAVSGLMIRQYLLARPSSERLKIGIIGWGPVGRAHFEMCAALFGDRIDRFSLYDLRGIDETSVSPAWRNRTTVAPRWEDAYENCGICITCTVAEHRYIDKPPGKGALLLNVSLRDYRLEGLQDMNAIVVDEWEEVCRENTDIELLHRERGLTKAQTVTLADTVCRGALSSFDQDEPVLFCPMGMASFDIAVAVDLVDLALAQGIGRKLQP